MASERKRRQQQVRAVAFGSALALHAVWLAMLAWVRPVLPPPLALPEEAFMGPAVEVSLLPRSSGGGQGGGLASTLRRLGETASAGIGLRGATPQQQAAPQSPPERPAQERAVATAAPSASPVVTARNAAQPSDLRPVQGLQPPPEPTPETLAARPTLAQNAALPAQTRPPRPQELRPIQAFTPEAEPETLAQRPSVQAPPSLTRSAQAPTRPELGAAQAYAPPEPTPETLAARTAVQAPPRLAAAPRSNAPAQLRPLQGAAIPEPEYTPPTLVARPELSAPPRLPQGQSQTARRDLRPVQGVAALEPEPETLAARPNAPESPSGVVATARPSPQQALRPAQGLSPPAAAGAGAGQPALAVGQGPSMLPPAAGAGAGAPGALAAAGQDGGGRGGNGLHPGCAPEDLILLTPAERERCRNEIDAFNRRLANQRAGEEAARRVSIARGAPSVDGIPPDKRAYYDQVTAAYAARRELYGGQGAGLSCNLSSLFGGPSGYTANKVRIPGTPCAIIPPTGALTEESRLTPP